MTVTAMPARDNSGRQPGDTGVHAASRKMLRRAWGFTGQLF
jgi:hypothetical protein